MRYVLIALVLLGSCTEEAVEPSTSSQVNTSPNAEMCTGAWNYARTEAYFAEPQWWPVIAEPAHVLGLGFCPGAPQDVLFMDVEFTGEEHTHRFTIVADPGAIEYGDTVKYQCAVLDLPVGEADTSATVRRRYGTQHDLSALQVDSASAVVLDFGTHSVVYRY